MAFDARNRTQFNGLAHGKIEALSGDGILPTSGFACAAVSASRRSGQFSGFTSPPLEFPILIQTFASIDPSSTTA
jgi:hypothetical protein